VSVDGQEIRLTLLKAAMAPDMTADRGRQVFTYAFFAWDGPMADSALQREAYELNVALATRAGDGGTRSVFSIDHPGIVIDTIKPAEDGSQDLILRMYEWRRTATRCMLHSALDLARACVTDMLERGEDALPILEGNSVPLEFRPFEIKTLRLTVH